MQEILNPYLPASARSYCTDLLASLEVEIKIVKMRVSRHGDYRKLADGRHIITLNANPNPYRFLITLIHEIAHLKAFEEFGRGIKPHGREWKRSFQHMMLPVINPEVFPSDLLPSVANHFKNPRASSSTDAQLSLALKNYDPASNTTPVLEIPKGDTFRLYNGKLFRRGQIRTKRIECVELATGRLYLFQPSAEVVRTKDY